MADKLGIGTDVRKLRLGDSFTKNGPSSFHTIRYDFKPASVDMTKVATVDIGQGNQVTVTVPHIEGSGTAQTVFKGSKKPYNSKECVLFIDSVTGEFTLERLNNNITVKKTRAEGSSKMQLQQTARPITPVDHNSSERKASPNDKHTSPNQKNLHSPTKHSSSSSLPSTYHTSPPQRNSPTYQQKSSGMPNSLPQTTKRNEPSTAHRESSMPLLSFHNNDAASEVGVLSDSSSSSSKSSSSGSDSESDNDDQKMELDTPPLSNVAAPPPVANHSSSSFPSMPQFSQLSEDLQLSESGSDSD